MNLDAMRWRLKAIQWKAKAYDLLVSRLYWDEQACMWKGKFLDCLKQYEAKSSGRPCPNKAGGPCDMGCKDFCIQVPRTQHDAGTMRGKVHLCPNLGDRPCPTPTTLCSVRNGGCQAVWSKYYDRSSTPHDRP